MNMNQSIAAFAAEKLGGLKARDIKRDLHPTWRKPGGRVERGGKTYLCFCDNDYLGLSQDARVIEAAKDAAGHYGAGAGASRLVVGDHPLNAALEEKIAAFKGMPAARLFGSGYMANIGVIPALVGKGDLIVMDELSHACMHAGAQLSGATIAVFDHNDPASAARAFETAAPYRQGLLLTETVFSMDGDQAPLTALAKVVEEKNGWMMTDDAHGFGVVKIDNPAAIQMGTLSKAVGAYGGYVCGPAEFIELLISRARSFVYTTGLPPATVGAAIKAVDIIETEPEHSAKALANAALFCDLIGAPKPESCIVPILIGEAKPALEISERLADAGYLVTAFRPPTVAAGTARLRFTFSAAHEEKDVRAVADAYLAAQTPSGAIK